MIFSYVFSKRFTVIPFIFHSTLYMELIFVYNVWLMVLKLLNHSHIEGKERLEKNADLPNWQVGVINKGTYIGALF